MVSLSAAEVQVEPAGKVDYNRDVRPILARNCFACHGQDEAKRAKGLRLDRRDSAVKPLKNGDTAIVPGDPDSSELIARITEEDDTMRMPPAKAGNRLTPAEVDVSAPLDRARGRIRSSLGFPRPQGAADTQRSQTGRGRATASTSGSSIACRKRV